MHADSQAFPRSHRLLKGADYGQVFQKAHKASDKWFTVLAHRSNRAQARLGLAIAKKQLHRAVDRNRLKRLIRESFRHHQAELQGLDLVVMARSGCAQQDNATLFAALEKLWAKQAHWHGRQSSSA